MNETYNTILFDLDGTLTDPRIGITKSVQYALKAFDIDEPNLDNLCKFIGPPLKDSFIQFYNFDEKKAAQAVERYRERYTDTGIYETHLYRGIDKLLEKLSLASKQLVVATSKPTVFAKRILEHFRIDHFFILVSGSELDNTRTSKGEVIRYGLEQLKITDISDAVMIGDREYDIIGAKKVGMASIGVLYGYGSYYELKNAGANIIIKDIEGLSAILL